MKQITEQDLLALWSMYSMTANTPTEQGFWDRLTVQYHPEEMEVLRFPVFPPRGAGDFDARTMLVVPDPSEPVEPPDTSEPIEPTEPAPPIDPVDCDRMGWVCPRCRGGVAPTIERCPCVELCGTGL